MEGPPGSYRKIHGIWRDLMQKDEITREEIEEFMHRFATRLFVLFAMVENEIMENPEYETLRKFKLEIEKLRDIYFCTFLKP